MLLGCMLPQIDYRLAYEIDEIYSPPVWLDTDGSIPTTSRTFAGTSAAGKRTS